MCTHVAIDHDQNDENTICKLTPLPIFRPLRKYSVNVEESKLNIVCCRERYERVFKKLYTFPLTQDHLLSSELQTLSTLQSLQRGL